MRTYIGKGHLDRRRATRHMQEAGLDALLLIQPESIVYATGGSPGNATKTRRLGAAFLLIPADLAEPVAAIIGDYYVDAFRRRSEIDDLTSIRIWVDTADVRDSRETHRPIRERIRSAYSAPDADRPSSFDRAEALAELARLLTRRGFADARIGTEMAFLPHIDATPLFEATPGVRWVDASSLVARLRAVKSAGEIAMLRTACRAAEIGMEAVTHAFRDGVPGDILRSTWEFAATDAARRSCPDATIDCWTSLAIGVELAGAEARVSRGDLVKLDVGCVIDGYSSDGARTFCMGAASTDAHDIYTALKDAQARAIGALRIGHPCSAVFTAARSSMRASGFSNINRGHFGHSLGASLFVEEYPFFAADERFLIESDMVVAVEAPWYIKGIGALMVEDPLLITAGGPEPLWQLDRGLIEL